MKIKYIILLAIILVIPLINAEKINNPVNLIQTCNNCTYCNVSKITYPNSSIVLTNQIMTQDGSSFNYTLNSNYVNTLGPYTWYYYCGNEIESLTGNIQFIVSQTGYQSDTGKSIIMILGLVLLLITSIIIFYFGYNLENITVKVFSIGLSLTLLIFSIGYGLTVLNATVGEFSGITNLIDILYKLSVALLTVGGISVIVWLIYVSFEMFSKYRGFRD